MSLPDQSPLSFTCLWEDCAATGMDASVRTFTGTCRLRSSPVSCHWPTSLGLPTASPSSFALACPSLTPSTSFHCHMPVLRFTLLWIHNIIHIIACWQPGPLWLPACLQLALALADALICWPLCGMVAISACHYSRHLHWAPEAEYAHTTNSSHHHCLLCFLDAGPGCATEEPNNPYRHCIPQHLPSTTWLLGAMDTSSLSWSNVIHTQTQSHPTLGDLHH